MRTTTRKDFQVVKVERRDISSVAPEAHKVFLASHMALVVPSVRAFVLKCFFKMPAVWCAVLFVVALLTLMAANITISPISLPVSVVLQVVFLCFILWLYSWGSFYHYLRKKEGCPLQNATRVFVEGDPQSALFVVTSRKVPSTASTPTSPPLPVYACLALLAPSDGEHFRHILLPPPKPNTCILRNVGALPKYHGLGMGHALLDAALEHAKRSGFKEVWLTTTSIMASAVRMYLRAGFETVQQYPGTTYDVLVMKKCL